MGCVVSSSVSHMTFLTMSLDSMSEWVYQFSVAIFIYLSPFFFLHNSIRDGWIFGLYVVYTLIYPLCACCSHKNNWFRVIHTEKDDRVHKLIIRPIDHSNIVAWTRVLITPTHPLKLFFFSLSVLMMTLGKVSDFKAVPRLIGSVSQLHIEYLWKNTPTGLP